MLKIYYHSGNELVSYDFETENINKNSISVGFVPEYKEKTSIDGTLYRDLKGYRLTANWTHPTLFVPQREKLMAILDEQFQSGNGLLVEMDIPFRPPTNDSNISFRKFKGYMHLDISTNGKFGYSSVLNEYIWTGFGLTLTSVSLVRENNYGY